MHVAGMAKVVQSSGQHVQQISLSQIITYGITKKTKLHGLSREQTILTERQPLLGEVIANFCG
jgi:hypothetical protein